MGKIYGTKLSAILFYLWNVCNWISSTLTCFCTCIHMKVLVRDIWRGGKAFICQERGRGVWGSPKKKLKFKCLLSIVKSEMWPIFVFSFGHFFSVLFFYMNAHTWRCWWGRFGGAAEPLSAGRGGFGGTPPRKFWNVCVFWAILSIVRMKCEKFVLVIFHFIHMKVLVRVIWKGSRASIC